MPSLSLPRIRHLRKRSTYLIINLSVADLLVVAVAGPLYLYHRVQGDHLFFWPSFSLLAFKLTFLIASPVNLSLISLEGLHATLFSFKHYLLRKWFYFKIIIGSWFITLLLGSLMAGLYLKQPDSVCLRMGIDRFVLLHCLCSHSLILLFFQTFKKALVFKMLVYYKLKEN